MSRMQLAVACVFCVLGATICAEIGSPVEKVVHLLQDLKAKIEHDGKQEELVYNKFACWCEKTTDRKAGAITDAQEELRSLGQSILKLKGRVATLTAELEELAANIAANMDAQEKATAIREKENAAFAAQTAEMKQVLAALEKAIIVLGKGSSSSMLQVTSGSAAIKAVVQALPSTVALKPQQMALLHEFMGVRHGSKYMPQSMTVQGILQDMYDTFSTDLESATATEATSNTNFENLIAAKTEELLQMKAMKTKKEDEKAEAETELADTTQSYDDTNTQMKADIKFFDEAKASCQEKHDAWTTRDDLRAEELGGISKAIAILSTDKARHLFAKSIKAGKETGADDSYDTGVKIDSFLQVGTAASAAPAYEALRAQAAATHSLRLAALAVQVREAKVGHFDKVIAAIDEMMKTLQEEDTADVAKRDQCKDEYQKIDSTVADVRWLIEKNVAKIDKLESIIAKRTEEKLKTIEEIKDVTEHIAAMEDQRITENQVFLAAKSDDQAAIELLMEARKALRTYFDTNDIALGPIQGSVKGAALNQEEPVFEVSADQAPDATFTGKGHRKNESKGIVQIMTMIIEDLNDEIKNGMKSEEGAQLQFEKMLKAAKTLQSDLIAKKLNLEEVIANREEDKDAEHEDMVNNKNDLKGQLDYQKEITPDCDWIIGAFTQRATRRTAEMNGLESAKAFLAGKQAQASLIEKKGTFDDSALSRVTFRGLRQ